MNAALRFGSRASSFLALSFAVLFSACQTIPETPGRNVEVLLRGQLEEVQPMDVVVAPIIDQSAKGGVPHMELREAFQRNLVNRRYSPLSIPYTDRRVVNASYQPGSLKEDAILQITVKEWDLSRWESNGEVKVSVEAWMLASENLKQLWGGRLDRTIYLDKKLQDLPTKKGALRDAAEQVAVELLEVMPARSPKP